VSRARVRLNVRARQCAPRRKCNPSSPLCAPTAHRAATIAYWVTFPDLYLNTGPAQFAILRWLPLDTVLIFFDENLLALLGDKGEEHDHERQNSDDQQTEADRPLDED
jgi:hypothetical protein